MALIRFRFPGEDRSLDRYRCSSCRSWFYRSQMAKRQSGATAKTCLRCKSKNARHNQIRRQQRQRPQHQQLSY